MANGYQEIISPEDVENVNQNTQALWNMLQGGGQYAPQGFLNQSQSAFNQAMNAAGDPVGANLQGLNIQNLYNQAMPGVMDASQYASQAGLPSGDGLSGQSPGAQGLNPLQQGAVGPNAAMGSFVNQWAPQLQNLVSRPMDQYESMANQRVQDMTQQTAQDVASQFSGLGALYSGAAGQRASEEAQKATRDAALQLGQQRMQQEANLLGQLYGQGLGELGAGYRQTQQLGTEVGLQGAEAQQQAARTLDQLGLQQNELLSNLYGQQAGMYGNLAGQGLSMIGQLSQPQYIEPTVVAEQPEDNANWLSALGSGLTGAGSGAVSGAGLGSVFGLPGAAVGGALGGLGGFLTGL